MRSHSPAYIPAILVVTVLSGGVAAAILTGTVATGLSNPRGIGLAPGGRVLVAQIDSGAVSEIRAHGHGTSVSTLVQLQAQNGNERVGAPVDVAAHGLGNTFVLMSGPVAQLLHVGPNGHTSLVADIGAYQLTDPDPVDKDNFPEESNPNGLAILDGDNVLVADAANNDLLHITKQGAIETVARFPLRRIHSHSGRLRGR